MVKPLKTVVVLVANPALSSILSTTLAGAPSLRVRAFDSELALRSYLQVAPADLLVADFDSGESRADHLAERLRADAGNGAMQIVALASEMTADVRAAGHGSDIDEIIMKPMSPRYLVERVLARMGKARLRRRGLNRRDWSRFGDNVVPLFRDLGAPQP